MYKPLLGSTPQTTEPLVGAAGALVTNEGSHGGGAKPLDHVKRRLSAVLPKSPGVAGAGAGDEPSGEGVGVGIGVAGSGVGEADARGALDVAGCCVPHPARIAAASTAHAGQPARLPTVATSAS